MKKFKLTFFIVLLINCAGKTETEKFGQKYVSRNGKVYSEANNTDYSKFYGKTIKSIYCNRKSPVSSYQVIIIFEDGSRMGVHNYKYEPKITY